MIYHLTDSDNYLRYLIARGKQNKKEKKTKSHPNTKLLHIFRMNGTTNTTEQYNKAEVQQCRKNVVQQCRKYEQVSTY